MRRYYFDLRDDQGLSVDVEGLSCRDIKAVQTEAARALADMARDAVRSATVDSCYNMAIEVRDDDGKVLNVKFRFEVTTLS
jgi:hypothetical protein